jgi:hypothetical protein
MQRVFGATGLRAVLVAAQIALSLVLLVAAGLFDAHYETFALPTLASSPRILFCS